MNKKYIWIMVAIGVIALIIGVILGPRIVGDGDGTPVTTEPDKYSLDGKAVISPDIPSESVALIGWDYKVFNEGMLAAGMLVVDMSLENKSQDRVISRAVYAVKVFDGKDGKGKELLKDDGMFAGVDPGETRKIRASLNFSSLDSPKSYIVSLESLVWKTTTVSPTTEPVPITTPSVGLGSKETVLAFWTAIQKGQYAEAGKYLISNKPFGPKEIKEAEDYYQANPGQKIQKIEITQSEEHGTTAVVRFILHLVSGERVETKADLEIENGVWKLL